MANHMIEACAMWEIVPRYLNGYGFKETGYNDIRIYFHVSFQEKIKNFLQVLFSDTQL